MIKYTTGDLLEDNAQAIVNTVNCVGVMGRGIALQFKKKFTQNFKAYAAACEQGRVMPGKMFVYTNDDMFGPKWIINFPTKRHWKGKSRMEDIAQGLDDLVKVVKDKQIQSIAIPPLGSGLGGLNWQDVKKLIETKLATLPDVEVRIYEPSNVAEKKHVAEIKVPKMTAGRAALVGLVDRYLNGLLDPSISLLEVHKLMFFLQEAGEPLRLNYHKAAYGPYADNLRHVFNAIEGHFIKGYQDGGDAPDKQIELMPNVIEQACDFLNDKPETKQHFDRVAQLVEGFETAYGLELLSTVYWVAKNEGACSIEQAREKIHCWNERKKQFSEKQITVAYQTLQKQQWV
ncbi:MAG: macro domain-containing protein [Moraxella osloensis]|nr:macro domain-containing protein [Moraxella osloensis]MBD3768075.1 macro domain-containing protein [Gammaproteobacteria bacterium]